MELLSQGFVYLLAAVVAVPVANRLGLGSVLGYLIAGIVIGPALGVVGSETEQIKHFAEFGVVMMLFLVGLELRPAMLWRMRAKLLGLGGLQVAGSTAVFAAAGWAFGLAWQSAVGLGLILALSSTAIVLQTLNEKGWMKLPAGQSTFSVLLFQDIAVIPILAVLPLLAVAAPEAAAGASEHGGALDRLPGWLQTLAILGVIAAIVVAGKYLMRPVFRFIAQSRLREIFTAAALLLVVGIALVMDMVGLSPALGTFLAGVVLSDSEYRHELESDIEPFKGLLLGLFFISVGAGIDFGLLFGQPAVIFGLAAALMAVKFVILLALARAFRLTWTEAWLFALALAQAGEFAFVLLGFAGAGGVLGGDLIETVTLVVAVTMLFTPVLFIFYEHVIQPRAADTDGREADEIDEQGAVIVAGVGRFGQVVSRMLMANDFKVVVLDHDAGLIETLRKVGTKTFYGDATRPDLLHAAGAEHASLFVAAMDDRERQTELVEHVARHHPGCRIIARAVDRHHVYELENAGAHVVVREMFESALAAGRRALIEMGHHPFRAEQKARAFRRHDLQSLAMLREPWNASGLDKAYFAAAKARGEELSQVMSMDRAERHDTTERGWTPPPKGDADA